MKAKKFVYLLVGIALMVVGLGAYAAFAHDYSEEFGTDDSILTMTLPQEEGFKTTPTFELETEFPRVPDALGIYRLNSPDVNKEYVHVLARSKGLGDIAVEDQGPIYVVQTDKDYFSVEKASGAESMVLDYQNAYQDMEKTVSNEEVLKRNADAYVQRNKLLTSGYQYSGMSYLTRQLIGENGLEGRPENMMGLAKYSRSLEDLPIVGAGSTITVLLGEDGIVQGFTKVSREIGERIGVASLDPISNKNAYQLIAPEEAFLLLQERGLTTEVADLDKAVITEMYLAYYEAEGSVVQGETEPIYVFSGFAVGPDGRIEFQEYMYALKAKAGRAPQELPDRSKAVNRDDISVPDQGSKDEGELLLATPLREVRLTPVGTLPLQDLKPTPRLTIN